MALDEVAAVLGQLEGGSSTCTPKEFVAAIRRQAPLSPTTDGPASLDEALSTWLGRVRDDPDWNATHFGVSTRRRFKLDDLWVELHLVDAKDVTADDLPSDKSGERYGGSSIRVYRRRSWNPGASISIHTFVRNLGPDTFTVVVGDPGGGKTTLAKRLTRSVATDRAWDFRVPVLVRLREWASSQYFGRPDSLLRWFFEDAGHPPAETERLAREFREQYSMDRDGSEVLLLLDGWDEVTNVREAAAAAIRAEDTGWTTVLFSRPSGLSQAFDTDGMYVLADLSADAVEHAIGKFFAAAGNPTLAPGLLAAVQTSESLAGFARNPFLLHLLCRLVETGAVSSTSMTVTGRTQLYRLGIDQILADYRSEKQGDVPAHELQRLKKLAANRTFRTDGLEYYFHRGDLPNGLRTILDGPCEKARLVSTDGDRSERQGGYFLHATLQEYLAAQFLADQPPNRVGKASFDFALARPWETTFRFVAGVVQDEAANLFWSVIDRELEHDDRFGLVASLAARYLAQLPLDSPHRHARESKVIDRLWRLLEGELRGVGWCEELVSIWFGSLVELDVVSAVKGLHEWAGRGKESTRGAMAVDMLRWEVVRPGLVSRVRAIEQDWIRAQPALEDDFVSTDARDLKHRWYADGAVALEELYRVREHVAGLDGWMVKPLLDVLSDRNCAAAHLLDSIECLGGIATPESAAGLAEFLLDGASDERLRTAYRASWDRGKTRSRDMLGDMSIVPFVRQATNRNSEVWRWGIVEKALNRALDPASRDRLLQELCLRALDDPVVPRILRTIEGVPITHGADAIMGVVKSSATDNLSMLALSALRGAITPAVDEFLVMLGGDASVSVRLRMKAQELLVDRLPRDDGHALCAIIDSPLTPELRSKALAMLARTVSRLPGTAAAALGRVTVLSYLARVIEDEGAADPDSEFAMDAILAAVHVGPPAAPQLLELARSDAHDDEIRVLACRALGEIGDGTTAGPLAELASCPPASPDSPPLDRVATTALEALAKIDPVRLLGDKNVTTERLLKKLCGRRHWRIYSDHIVTDIGVTLGIAAPTKRTRRVKLTDDAWDFLNRAFSEMALGRESRQPWLTAIGVDSGKAGWGFVESPITHPEFATLMHGKLRTQRMSVSLRAHIERLLKQGDFSDEDADRLRALLDVLSNDAGSPRRSPPDDRGPPSRRSGNPPPPPPTGAPPVEVVDQVPPGTKVKVVVVVATGWGPLYGGINSFNYDFTLALGRTLRGAAKVVCLTTNVDDLTRKRLEGDNVRILTLRSVDVGAVEDAREVLIFDKIGAVDLVIGHDVITGPAAIALAKVMGGKSTLFHHMSYIQYQGEKKDGKTAVQMDAEQKAILTKADYVIAVGPLLKESAERLCQRTVPMVVPGMAAIPAITHRPAKAFRAITFGRMGGDDGPIKQGSLAVAGYGRYVKRSEELGAHREHRFTMYGLPEAQYAAEENALKELMRDEAGRQIAVNATPYTDDRKKLFDALADNEVALMLSWHEGFGLVGWEAIAAEVPLVVSKRTGLYKLLSSPDDPVGAACVSVVDVRGFVDGEPDDADVSAVADALLRIAVNWSDNYEKAKTLRRHLAEKYTWEKCVQTALQACGFTATTRAATPTGVTTIQFVAGDRGGSTRSQLAFPNEEKAIRDARTGQPFAGGFRNAYPVFNADVDQLIECHKAEPSILHFVGHGEERQLVLASRPFLPPTALPPEHAETLFREFRPRLRLLVLNSCNSLDLARHLADQGVVGMAIGFGGKIGDDPALQFTKTFYAQLAAGKSARRAFDLAMVHFPPNTGELFHAPGVKLDDEYFGGR